MDSDRLRAHIATICFDNIILIILILVRDVRLGTFRMHITPKSARLGLCGHLVAQCSLLLGRFVALPFLELLQSVLEYHFVYRIELGLSR